MRPVPAPIIGVPLRRGLVVQDEHVFRVPGLSGLGEIIRARGGAHDVHHHKLVVHELVLAVVPDTDAVLTQAVALGTAGLPLVGVQYHPDLDIPLPRADERVGYGHARERVRGHTHGPLGGVYEFNQTPVARFAGREADGNGRLAGEGRDGEHKKEDEEESGAHGLCISCSGLKHKIPPCPKARGKCQGKS